MSLIKRTTIVGISITLIVCTTNIKIGSAMSLPTNIPITPTTSDGNGATTTTPFTNGKDGATMTTPYTNGHNDSIWSTPFTNDGGDATTTTPFTNGGSDATMDTTYTKSGIGATVNTHSTARENGVTEAPSISRGNSGANTTVNSNDLIDEETTIVYNDTTPENSTSSLPEDDTSGWVWSTVTFKWHTYLELVSAIVGIFGNLLVIVVIFKRRASGRTTDILIGSLAIADFLTSIFIIPHPKPIHIPDTWQGMLYCVVLYQDLLFWMSVTASSYILMAISVERYIAVVYPLRFNQIVTMRRVNAAVGLIWFAAFLSLLFTFFIIRVDNSIGYCTLTITTSEGYSAMGYYWFCLRIIVPTVTMLVTQSLIAIELHRQSANFKRDADSSTNTSYHIVARNRVLKIMFQIIFIYIICWVPNQIAFLGAIVGFISWAKYIGSPLHRVLTVLGLYNSCVNPLIYAAQHPQFRIAIKELFSGKTNKNTPVFSGQKKESNKRVAASSKQTASTRLA